MKSLLVVVLRPSIIDLVILPSFTLKENTRTYYLPPMIKFGILDEIWIKFGNLEILKNPE